MANYFRFTFQMEQKDSNTCVCFKQDGQRFEQPYTVKLNADTDYQIKFTMRPAIPIDKLMINGDIYKLSHLKSTSADSDTLTFGTEFTTVGYDLTKSGRRKEILIVVELENGVYMKLSIQCKVYKVGDVSHAQWGQTLNAVECECEITSGQNYVKILKMKYL